MKKALISPVEKRDNGYRIVQVVESDQEFEIASPLFWMDCADNIEADHWFFNTSTRRIEQTVLQTSEEHVPFDPRNPFNGPKGRPVDSTPTE